MSELRSADVAVIGAGIVGTSLAWELTRRGATVTVVEKEAVGAGASGRNAGSLVSPLAPQLRALYHDTLAQIQQLGAPIAPKVRPAGMLMLANDADEARALADELGERHPELEPEYLEPREVAALEPAVAAGVAACRSSAAHCVDPLALTTAFMEDASRSGATLVTSEGRLLARRGRIVGVTTALGDVHAESVVICSGYSPDNVLQAVGISVPVGPVWGVVAEVRLPQPPRHVLLEASAFRNGGHTETTEQANTDHREVNEVGFGLVTIDGVSALGHSLSSRCPDSVATVPKLVAGATPYISDITDVALLSTRLCARPTSRDDLPVLGAVPGYDNCYVAVGHGGKGVTIGPGTAKLLADVMHGEATVPSTMDVRRYCP